MFDPTTMAIITGAAGNIVAYMLSGRIDDLRGWVTRAFRRTETEREKSLLTVEEDMAALREGRASAAEVKLRWTAMLAAYLAAEPEARADIDAMASGGKESARSVRIWSQHNHGSGIFIGGDNFGGIDTREE